MSQNIKAVILTTLATVFVALSTPACAGLSNGKLYENCKPFVDRAFSSPDVAAVTCIGFFRGIADAGHRICTNWEHIITDDQYPTEARKAISIVRSYEGLKLVKEGDLKAAVQHYVNGMSKTPEKWQYIASLDVHNSLKKMAPCE